MLDVCLLGTSGMLPLPGRWLTSLMTRYNGSSLLIDCGEGTQIAIKEKGWSYNPIDVICFTHYHADHISGLPGLLLTIGNSDRTQPLTLIGPKGLGRMVSSLRVIAPELPFELNIIEMTGQQEHFSINGYEIEAFKVNHAVTCYGYSISIPRIGKFNVERAKELGIPCNAWNKLQHGSNVEIDGITYTPDMVMGEARKGIKVTYCTDTRPVQSIVDNAMDSDLFVCEGMYGEKEKENKAKEYKHMTFYEAAELARKSKVKQMWLTHYSPSLVKPGDYINNIKHIFENVVASTDGQSVTLEFED
ncbi:MAG: ribonuclease Z [Eubacteriales bacterium]|nr:ribonuclease Z [Eubacteriales bacterium]